MFFEYTDSSSTLGVERRENLGRDLCFHYNIADVTKLSLLWYKTLKVYQHNYYFSLCVP